MISVTRIFRLTMRFAQWAEPYVKEWHKKRHFHRVEGQRHLDSRNWAEAEKHLTTALGERRHSKQRRCELLLNVESAQRKQGKLVEAEKSASEAFDIAPGRALRARAQDALVDLELDLGRHQQAEQRITEILRTEQAGSRPDGARVAKCYRKLGVARLKNNQSAEALEAFRQSAELSERVFGQAHVETAQSFADLGMLYRQFGDHAQAQLFLRRALEIYRNAAGLDSREATQGLYQLASSLEESGDLDGAAGEFERLLALRARQVGVNPLENAETQLRLAGLYLKADRIGPAKELLSHAIGVLERRGGQPLAEALQMLAFAEESSGHFEEAKRWREVAANLTATAS